MKRTKEKTYFTKPDLKQYPTCSISPELLEKLQVIMGDAHGDFLFVIYFLIEKGVLLLSKENYQSLVDIYYSEGELTKKDLETVQKILKETKVQKVGLVRFLGDLLADRGKNDILILLLLFFLHKKGVNFKISFSNHDYMFFFYWLLKISKIKQDEEYYGSYNRMYSLIEKGIISIKMIQQILETAYVPYVDLFSLSFGKKIQQKAPVEYYTHGKVDFDEIKGALEECGLPPFEGKPSLKELCEAINKINTTLRFILLNPKWFFSFFKKNSSFLKIIDSRKCKYNAEINFIDFFIKGYSHGHTSLNEEDSLKTNITICSYDGDFGKDSRKEFSDLGSYHDQTSHNNDYVSFEELEKNSLWMDLSFFKVKFEKKEEKSEDKKKNQCELL